MENRAARGQGAARPAYWHKFPESTAPPTHTQWMQVDYLGSQLLKHFDIPFDGEAAKAPTPEDDKLVLARMKARLETEGEEKDDDAEEAEEEPPTAD